MKGGNPHGVSKQSSAVLRIKDQSIAQSIFDPVMAGPRAILWKNRTFQLSEKLLAEL